MNADTTGVRFFLPQPQKILRVVTELVDACPVTSPEFLSADWMRYPPSCKTVTTEGKTTSYDPSRSRDWICCSSSPLISAFFPATAGAAQIAKHVINMILRISYPPPQN